MTTSANDIYITGLRNAHALEMQATQLIDRQVERLENYPEMAQMLRRHGDESREQAKRLDRILEARGSDTSSIKDFGLGLMGNIAAMTHAIAQDEVIKNSLANFAFEHFEIASYRALLVMAEAAGDHTGPEMLRQSLAEEERMAKWIGENLESTVQRYIQLETSGQKSGV